MIKVFHATPFGVLHGFNINRPGFVLSMLQAGRVVYEHVADVLDTDKLNVAWESTNTIDHGWWENQNVSKKFKNPSGCRSTSVGDIFVGASGDAHIVCSFGFAALPPEINDFLRAQP